MTMTYTKLSEIVDIPTLEAAVEAGYIRKQTHPEHRELAIYNYSESCMWDKAWFKETMESRGLIVLDGNEPVVLARPFPKFFNWDEREISPEIIRGGVEVTDKMDGSLGIGYSFNGRWEVATRGSFASDQAKWASSWLYRVYFQTHPMFNAPDGWTPLWEILYPENRIVVNYNGYEGLVLLGWRNIATGQIVGPLAFPDHWRADRTEIMPGNNFADALLLEPRKNAEGVVVRWIDSGHQVKIKQEDYKRMHAVVTNTTNRSLWKLGPDAELPEGLPDEFNAWVKQTMYTMKHRAHAVADKVEVEFSQIFRRLNGDHSRAQFAALAKQSDNSAALFQKYDGKDVSEWCWKQIEPKTIERPFAEGS